MSKKIIFCIHVLLLVSSVSWALELNVPKGINLPGPRDVVVQATQAPVRYYADTATVTRPREILNGMWQAQMIPLKEFSLQDYPDNEEMPIWIKSSERPDEKKPWKDVLVPSMLQPGRQRVKSHKAWMKRTFRVPESIKNTERIVMHFGAFGGWGRVYVNGKDVGYGFAEATPFEVDVTDVVDRDGENDILLCVTASWTKYGGSLLKRHIITQDHWGWSTMGLWQDNWLLGRPAVCTDNVAIRTSVRKKTIDVTTRLRNDSKSNASLKVRSTVLDRGKEILSLPAQQVTLSPGQSKEIEASMPWKTPQLWSPENPYLYVLETVIEKDGKVIDVHRERFGFREIWRDGKHLMLNGHKLFTQQRTMFYQDTIDGYRARIRRVKSEGRNIIRCNGLAAPVFLHLADEEGMLIKEQIGWHHPGAARLAQDYEKNSKPVVRRWIERDRNHPSIVLWCATNEPYSADYLFVRNCLFGMMQKWIKEYDPTRLVDHEGIGSSVLNTKSKRNEFIKANFDIYNDHYPAPTRPIGELERYPENWFKHENFPLIFGEWYSEGPGRDGAAILGNRYYENQWEYFFNRGALADWPALKAELERIIPHWRGYQITGGDFWFAGHGHIPANQYNYAPRDMVRVLWRNWTGLGMKNPQLPAFDVGYIPGICPTDSDYQQTRRRLHAPLFVGWENLDHQPTGGSDWKKTLMFSNEGSADAKAVVRWRLMEKDGVSWPIDEGTLTVDVPEGTVLKKDVTIRLPKVDHRTECELILSAESNIKTGCSAPRDVTVFPATVPQAKVKRNVVLYDPAGTTQKALDVLGVKAQMITKPDAALASPGETLLIIGENGSDNAMTAAAPKLLAFIRNGGRILQLAQAKWTYWLSSVVKLESYPASYSFLQAKGNPIFAALSDNDMCNWTGGRGEVCSMVLAKPEKGAWKNLADAGEKMHMSLLAEIPEGKGSVLLCQYDLCPRVGKQAVPSRLLANLLTYASRPANTPNKVAFLASPQQLDRWKENLGLVPDVTDWAKLDTCTAAVVAPETPLSPKQAKQLEAFAKRGGTVLLIARKPEAITKMPKAPKIVAYKPDLRTQERQKESVRMYFGASSGPMGLVLKTDYDLLDGVNNADLCWRTFGHWGWRRDEKNVVADYMILCNATWQPITLPYAMAERKVGKGRIVVTTLKDGDEKGNWTPEISRIWGNVFSNLGATLNDDEAAMLQKGGFTCIGLAPYANAGIRDDVASDGKGGWADQGANDLRYFPTGRQVFNGVPFLIAKPDHNKGKVAISVASQFVKIPYPKTVKKISLGNKRYSRLYFLHTSAWSRGKLATYQIQYEKIYEIVQDIPIVAGERVTDWWWTRDEKDCKVAWKGPGGEKDPVAVYITVWENPYPKVPLEYLDIISENGGALFLLGVTGQE